MPTKSRWPAAEAGDDFMNWLDSPTAAARKQEAESLGGIGFDDEPVACNCRLKMPR